MAEELTPHFKPRSYQEKFINEFEDPETKLRRFLIIWPRRCLSGNSHIVMEDGSWKYLKDIKKGDKILAWNGLRFVKDTVKDVWQTGIKPTLKIHTPQRPIITTSHDHKFAVWRKTVEGFRWDRAGDLKERSQLLSYAGMELGTEHNPDLAEFVGYMTSDGYISGYQQPKFTNTNKEILERVESLALSLFGYKAIWRPKGNGYDLGFSNGTKGGGYTPNAIKELFRSEGQDVPKSRKRVLSFVWRLDEQSLLRYFAAVISADGSMYCHKQGFQAADSGHNIPPAKELVISCGKSEGLCWDYYYLLRKMGLVPRAPALEKTSNWQIKIGKSSDIKKLLTDNPIYGKQERQKEILDLANISTREKIVYNGCHRGYVRISEGQPEQLYDIETTTHHNFVANGYVVHNSGKDLTAWVLMVRAAAKRIGNYFYLLPTYSQARKVIIDTVMGEEGLRFLDHINPKAILDFNKSELKLTLRNGSVIQIAGSDSYNRLVGTNICGCIWSEWDLADPGSYTYLSPALRGNDGWAIFISTPRGKRSLFEMYQVAQNWPDEWFSERLTLDDTKHIPFSEIEKDKQQGIISQSKIDQEYWCSFEAAEEHSYYGKYIDEMIKQDRITSVPYLAEYPVHSAWDLGYGDNCSIVFFQVIGHNINIIDCYENNGFGLEHYIKLVKEKRYIYGKHIAPFDIRNHEISTGNTRWQFAYQHGITFEVCPKIDIEDGREAVRAALGSRIYIDEKKCSKLIEALKAYRKEYDDKTRLYKEVHDFSSHFCDATRYMCLSLPHLQTGFTKEDLIASRNRALYGTQQQFARVFRE